MSPWVFEPHSGDKSISKEIKAETKQRIIAHAARRLGNKSTRIDVKFRGAFCYIDALEEPELPVDCSPPLGESREEMLSRLKNIPTHLVRLKYSGDKNKWSLAFFVYSNEKYEPCLFKSGSELGTPEEGFDVGMDYII